MARKKGIEDDSFWGGINPNEEKRMANDPLDPYRGLGPHGLGGGPRGYDPAAVHEQNQQRILTDIMGEADGHRKASRWTEAVAAYTRVLGMPVGYDSIRALGGRGECYRMLSRFKEALQDFDGALRQEPDNLFALRGKAGVLEANGKYDEAIVYCDSVLRRAPTDPWALKHRASITQAIQQGAKPPPVEETENEAAHKGALSVSDGSILDEQGRDITKLAREGKLFVAGREREIRAAVKALLRRTKANPLLIGPPGVGKTSLVEGVAQWFVRDAPEEMQNLRIVELSMASLVADTKYRGTFEKRLKRVVEECMADPNIILFIDEIHTLVGAGRTEDNSLDAGNILKPALARGEIRVIGATTTEEYNKYVKRDAALERRFFVIPIGEPTVTDAVEMIDRVKGSYEKHHGVVVSRAVVEACVKLSSIFILDRYLPDKAFDLLDAACVDTRMLSRQDVTREDVVEAVVERTSAPVAEVRKALDA